MKGLIEKFEIRGTELIKKYIFLRQNRSMIQKPKKYDAIGLSVDCSFRIQVFVLISQCLPSYDHYQTRKKIILKTSISNAMFTFIEFE